MIANQALPADFPSAELVTPKQVIFKSDDGLEIHGQLFVPPGRTAPGPALIFTHGGSMRQMMLGFHYMQYYHNAYAENQYLASLGYAVLSVNYRTGIMYGRAFRMAPKTGWRGGSEYKDVVAGAQYLRSLPYVDENKIGLWGGSYGGYLTAMGLARRPGCGVRGQPPGIASRIVGLHFSHVTALGALHTCWPQYPSLGPATQCAEIVRRDNFRIGSIVQDDVEKRAVHIR
jgi:acetyl esterase/lipase